MATITWTELTYNGEGRLFTAALGNDDNTESLKMNEAQSDISVHLYGTIGGATATARGSLNGTQFNVVDDAYGQAMSYTAVTNVLKPVGPTLTALRVYTAGGATTAITADVLVRPKVRP